MAEARLGVGFRFSVTHDGHLDIDYDRELFALIYHAGRRAWVKRALRYKQILKSYYRMISNNLIRPCSEP